MNPQCDKCGVEFPSLDDFIRTENHFLYNGKTIKVIEYICETCHQFYENACTKITIRE